MNAMSVALQDGALPNRVQYQVRLTFAHTQEKILGDFDVLSNGREYLRKLGVSGLKQTEGGVITAVDNLNVLQFGTRTIVSSFKHNPALSKQRKALWTDLNAFIGLLQKQTDEQVRPIFSQALPNRQVLAKRGKKLLHLAVKIARFAAPDTQYPTFGPSDPLASGRLGSDHIAFPERG